MKKDNVDWEKKIAYVQLLRDRFILKVASGRYKQYYYDVHKDLIIRKNNG